VRPAPYACAASRTTDDSERAGDVCPRLGQSCAAAPYAYAGIAYH